IKRLIEESALEDTAIVVNEFGAVGIDNAVINEFTDDVVLLSSGCVCCTVRTGLADTLNSLYDKRIAAELPPFKRIVIETTGIADPGPIANNLVLDQALLARFELHSVMTTVDLTNFLDVMKRNNQVAAQILTAGFIIFTKGDLVSPERHKIVFEEVKEMNPVAQFANSDDLAAVKAHIESVDWMSDYGKSKSKFLCLPVSDEENDAESHNDRYASVCLRSKEPFYWVEISTAMDSIVRELGHSIVRIKGIVNVVGLDTPLLIHAVQNLFHEPIEMKAWPDGEVRSEIVFIGREKMMDRIERHLPKRESWVEQR
ncbi:MAG TPA: GTP-binding protein, partial [Hyphomicrobium sp.]|nr:GTP-binding protein [Hyphomicrobium sp.]